MKSGRSFALLATIAFSSCTTGTYRSEVQLSNTTFESSDGLLKGQVPEGWFVSTDSEIAPHLAAWLIRNDYGAALTFQEIRLDEASAQYVAEEGLRYLADVSFHLKLAEESDAFLVTKPTESSIRGKSFCSYEYNSPRNGGAVSIAVFRSGRRFYESSAYPLKVMPSTEFENIQSTQQAVVLTVQP